MTIEYKFYDAYIYYWRKPTTENLQDEYSERIGSFLHRCDAETACKLAGNIKRWQIAERCFQVMESLDNYKKNKIHKDRQVALEKLSEYEKQILGLLDPGNDTRVRENAQWIEKTVEKLRIYKSIMDHKYIAPEMMPGMQTKLSEDTAELIAKLKNILELCQE